MSLRSKLTEIVATDEQAKAAARAELQAQRDAETAAQAVFAADALLSLLSDESLLALASTWVPEIGPRMLVRILNGRAVIGSHFDRHGRGKDLPGEFPASFPAQTAKDARLVARVAELAGEDVTISFETMHDDRAHIQIMLPGGTVRSRRRG